METPDSTPPAEAGAETYLTGQVVPKASGSDQSEFDTPETEDGGSQAPAGPVWRFLISPRWIAWHLFVVAAFWGMLWLGDWQLHRAMEGNGLSWAYTFEWPLFAGFAIVFWARTIRDEFHMRRGGVSEKELIERAALAKAMATLPKGAMLPAGTIPDGFFVRQLEQAHGDEEDDPELASYNAYLAKLNNEVKGHNKWLRALNSK
ncbi:MAG TPA: hypothetical protein VFE59_25990 [Trebonia sp.]|jgi:hypothetical protein|nr:hypothetical protein [Trebonia sp.]